jgi:hypothetical protein
VISLRLKLKWELNALLPARAGLGAPAFEYSIRDFFEAQNIGVWGLVVFWVFHGFYHAVEYVCASDAVFGYFFFVCAFA